MHGHGACSSFHDARRRTAEAMAGQGLPMIEPGMPTPAGTGLSRRTFMLGAGSLAVSVYGANKLGLEAFEEGVANAAGGPANPVLVNIFLEGGIDQLSVLAPVNDPLYISNRPTLKLAEDSAHTFSGDPRLQWHPKALGIRDLYEAGKVSVIPSIGHEMDDQSHFTSRHYWEVGTLDYTLNTGWLGRYLALHGASDNPLQGLSLDNTLSPTLATGNAPVAALINPSDYQLTAAGVGSEITQKIYSAYGAMGAANGGDQAIEYARSAVRNTERLRSQLASFSGAEGTTDNRFSFNNRLQLIVDMLKGGLPLRCVALRGVGGYDTHADQPTVLANNLEATVAGIVGFQSALEANGLADRVIMLVWTEFGRRVKQNANGTDHGAAGVGFVIGTRVKKQVVGEWSGLATLDNGNQIATIDYRQVYSAILNEWLGADPGPIIPGADQFGGVSLIRP